MAKIWIVEEDQDESDRITQGLLNHEVKVFDNLFEVSKTVGSPDFIIIDVTAVDPLPDIGHKSVVGSVIRQT